MTDEEYLQAIHAMQAALELHATEIERLRQRNQALQKTLNKEREPDGERHEQVAEWLRRHGYKVEPPD